MDNKSKDELIQIIIDKDREIDILNKIIQNMHNTVRNT